VTVAVFISPEFFDVYQRPPNWPDDPYLRRATDWLISSLPSDEWKARRWAALERFLNTATGESASDQKGRFFAEGDQAAWHLFLGCARLDHPLVYDFVFGARVVPVLRAIGCNLDLLQGVAGLGERVRRLLGPERSKPNAGFFELLVAIAYRRIGAQVRFVPERPGVARTHDLDVLHRGNMWAIECKRLEVGEYSERERQVARQLWMPVAGGLQQLGVSVLCKVQFVSEMSAVPAEYLAPYARDWLGAGMLVPRSWSDSYSIGSISRLDLKPLQRVLSTDDVALNSTRFHELVLGEYKRDAHYTQLVRVRRADVPLYVKECDQVLIMDWESRSSTAIEGKARDILKRLADATKQLPDGRPCIVHIGFEAVDGLEVEAARYKKVMRSISGFDPCEKQLEYVYVSWFAPESPPGEPEGFDETSHWQAVRATRTRPLEQGFLVLPPDTGTRMGMHWDLQAL
jgi:hypothetical protein